MRIENQAIIFALLCKYTVEAKGDEGREIIQKGMIRYGRERGARMAARAQTNGDPIALWTNQAYGEWKPDYDGQMVFGTKETEPSFQTYIAKCAWCDAWKKYDLLEYGKEYCVNVDKAVYEGFCPDFVCTPQGQPMSWGGEQCVFDWGQPMPEEDVAKMKAKKQELGTSAMRDFDYHTAHMYYTITAVLKEECPEEAEAIIEKAVADYIRLFGQDEYDRILDFAGETF